MASATELRLRSESQARQLREQEELHEAQLAELRAQNLNQQQRLQEKEEHQHLLEMERRYLHNLVQELKVGQARENASCAENNPKYWC